MGKPARRHIAHGFTVLQNGFVIGNIDIVGIDHHGDHALLGTGFLFGQRRFLANEVLVPGNEHVEPTLGSREIGTEVERPGTPALFQTHAHEGTSTIPAQTQVLAGFLDRFGESDQELRRSVDLVTKLAGERDPVEMDRHTTDKHLAGVPELQRVVGDITARDAAEEITGIGPRDRDAVEFIGAVAIGHACFGQACVKPAAVRLLHGAGTKQNEVIIRQAGDGEVAIELALGRQHGGQGQAARLGNASGKNVVQEGPCTGPFELVLGEVRHLDCADSVAHGLNLTRDVVMGT